MPPLTYDLTAFLVGGAIGAVLFGLGALVTGWRRRRR